MTHWNDNRCRTIPNVVPIELHRGDLRELPRSNRDVLSYPSLTETNVS